MTQKIEDLIPPYIRGLPVYVPGRPIEDVEQELKIRAIKLASNENPLGPSPMAVQAMHSALPEAHRYPDGGTQRLREKLANLHGVDTSEVFVGLGSSELIDLAARVLLRRGTTGITAEGSYAPFSIAIRANDANLVLVPLRNFTFDLNAMAAMITADARVVYLANPNNPTGTAFGHAGLAEFLERVPEGVLVVLDEAYVHYARRTDMPRSMELFRDHENLLVLRTFSKVYGLAGLRMGYGIGERNLVRAMNKLRTPFNVSGLGQVAALAALDDAGHVRRSMDANRTERDGLHEGLTALGLRPVRSETNFIFIDIGPEAGAISDELLHRGVIVRPLGWMGFTEALRVSVGTAEENGKLLEALAQVCARRTRTSELASR